MKASMWTAYVLGLVGAACGAPELPDSDGGLPSWTLGEPEIVLGTIDGGPTAFSPIRAVSMGPRAELHVLLPQDHQVRVFNADGVFLGAIGNEGEGPGEFQRPTKLGFVGDTLWVLDDGARRVSFFHETSLVRVESYPDMDGLHPERLGSVEAVLAGPALLVATDVRQPGQPQVTSQPGTLLRYSEGRFDPIAAIDVNHIGAFMIKGTPPAIEAMAFFAQPFTAGSLWEVSSGGAAVAVVSPLGRVPDLGDAYSVTRMSEAGDTLVVASFSYEPIPVSDAVVDSLLAPYVGGLFTMSDVREAAYLPQAFPTVTNIVAGRDGFLWLAREALPDRDREWSVLSPTGQLVASLRAPQGYSIQLVEENSAWGLVTDEFDVPYLVRRPIRRD